MNIIGKTAFILSLLSLTAVGAAAQNCKPAHEFKTVTAGALTVAGYELLPYSSLEVGNKLGGVDGEIIDQIATKECLTVKLVAVDPAAVIQSVISGQADIAAGDWYRTAAREKVLGLSAPLYLDQMGIFSKEGFSKVAQLDGKRIGTVEGYLWVADLKKVFGSALQTYPSPVNLAQDMAAGRIDVAIDSYAVGIEAQKKGGYTGVKIMVAEPDDRVAASRQPGQANFPYTKNNSELGAALASDIVDLHKSGAIAEILKKHGLSPSAADVGEARVIN